jgi:hypothetical protein
MSKVLVNVNVLGLFTSAYDVVAPLDAGGVVLIHWRGRLLSYSESFQKGSGIQDLSTGSGCRVVLGLCRGENRSHLHLQLLHDWCLVVHHECTRR